MLTSVVFMGDKRAQHSDRARNRAPKRGHPNQSLHRANRKRRKPQKTSHLPKIPGRRGVNRYKITLFLLLFGALLASRNRSSNGNICRSVEDRHPESDYREPRDLSPARTSKKTKEMPNGEPKPNPNIQELESMPTHRKQTTALRSNRTKSRKSPREERKEGE